MAYDKKKDKETIDIILPSRIGDSVLTMPSLLCLKQLQEKYPEKNLNITIYSTNKMTRIIESLGLFKVKRFTNIEKLRTFFKQSDKAIFLEPSNNHLGFFAKKTYGINITGKRIKYQIDMPYLYADKTKEYMPVNLFEPLQNNFYLSHIAISNFGMFLEMGFTPEQILQTFKYNENSLNIKKNITKWRPKIDNYIIFCMEAAYGKKTDADRRFKEELYFEVSKNIYEKYGLKSAYIGINKKIKLPKLDYFYDFRKKLNFEQLGQLIMNSKCYIGNDTGPLHIANLFKKPSIGIYARKESMVTYHPIFKHLNNMSFGFPSLEYIDEFCSKLD